MKTAKTIRRFLPAALILAVGGCSAKPAAPSKPASPASVAKLPGEGDLVTVTLKPEAEERLKIVTAEVEKKAAPMSLTMGGDVVVAPGRSSIVSAPQTGTLVLADGASPPAPGLPVKKGQAIFTLLPILSADRAILSPLERVNYEAARADAEGQLEIARPQFENAKVILNRTERLSQSHDVPPSALVDARNAYDSAKATLDAAERRVKIFRKAMGEGVSEDAGKLAPLPLRAPADGVLINVNVQAGQQVPSGSVLFEVADLDPMYVKVPVFVAEEETIDQAREAAIGGLADAPGRPTRPAKPVQTTPSANPLATTVDLYYEVENHDGKLRPGQRVGVTLPLKGEAESLVVPYAAILYDHNGGAWVYESQGHHAYARRRVVVDHVVGTEAVLTSGPKPGTKVVTDGAAELFGTEFAGGK
ncbi:efflux RND transporter periplasmic adaptor subunit [Tundrisphaera lichenicola]|uniref:efflux RND transporter periplasmic adaptor subunit n=1 Tax=Tundrisphaera lichenicola TaxID=2029860 RepID=UPI003EC13708